MRGRTRLRAGVGLSLGEEMKLLAQREFGRHRCSLPLRSGLRSHLLGVALRFLSALHRSVELRSSFSGAASPVVALRSDGQPAWRKQLLCSSSWPNNSLERTRVTNARFIRVSSGAAQLKRWPDPTSYAMRSEHGVTPVDRELPATISIDLENISNDQTLFSISTIHRLLRIRCACNSAPK